MASASCCSAAATSPSTLARASLAVSSRPWAAATCMSRAATFTSRALRSARIRSYCLSRAASSADTSLIWVRSDESCLLIWAWRAELLTVVGVDAQAGTAPASEHDHERDEPASANHTVNFNNTSHISAAARRWGPRRSRSAEAPQRLARWLSKPQTSRKRRTATAEPTAPTMAPTIISSTPVPRASPGVTRSVLEPPRRTCRAGRAPGYGRSR